MKPVLIEVFICGEGCCANAQATVENAFEKFDSVEVKIYDTHYPPEIVKKYGVLRPPTVIVNHKIKITKIYPHLLKQAVAKELSKS